MARLGGGGYVNKNYEGGYSFYENIFGGFSFETLHFLKKTPPPPGT